MPVYHYTLNQATSRHAEYPTTDGYLRRDHWHQIGNDRITAMASNDGVIQVYLADRGGVILNRLDARAGMAEAPGLSAWVVRALRTATPHAMALIGLLRVCGIEPVGDGLRIAPQAPPERFTLDLPLLRLEVAPAASPENIGRLRRASERCMSGCPLARTVSGQRWIGSQCESH